MAEQGEGRDEDQERGEGTDDLFEDLDRFFTPDPSEGRGEPPEEELLPSDWRPDIESLDVGEERAGSTPGPEGPEGPDAPEEPDVPEEPERPPRDAGAESTSEMTGEDWTRLRDVLGEEDDEGEAYAYEPDTPEVAGDESLFGDQEEGGPGRPEWIEPGRGQGLTLDDLKKAPPEYRDLPGPRDAAPDQEQGPPAVSEEPAWSEPTIAEVEAAADQLAEEFRDAEEPPSEVEQDLLSDLEEPTGPRTIRVGAPESLTGPTWEEPTSQPLMAEPASAAPRPGRNMPAAVVTAFFLAVVALVCLVIAKVAFVAVAGIVILVGQAELYATMQRRGHQPATALGLTVGALILAGAYHRGEPAVAFFVVLGLFLSFLWYMAAPLKARENLIRNVGSTMLGVLYVPVLAGYAFMLLAQPNKGKQLMATVIALTFVYDISAYAFGSFWGSRPLAPTVSPRKSWEGVLGATAITGIVGAVVLNAAVDYLSLSKALGLAIMIVVFAPLGDLVESLIKRDLGVKDMGSLLPGHGGVLDRIDSVLLVVPAAFYYIRLIF